MLFNLGMTWIWVAAMVFFLVVEAAAPGLVCIWFAVGCLAASVCAALNGPFWLQLFWCLVVSGAALFFTRPLVKRLAARKNVPTNADRNIGRKAIVTERIDNLAGTGAVKLDGVVWTARTADESVAEPGETVCVRDIQGVKLLVEPAAQKE